MKAKFTLLTHFSQRYAKIPMYSESFHSTTGIAFDNMAVRPDPLHHLPSMLPAIKKVFAEEHADMERKSEQRKIKKDYDKKQAKKKRKEAYEARKRKAEEEKLQQEQDQNEVKASGSGEQTDDVVEIKRQKNNSDEPENETQDTNNIASQAHS